MKVRNGFVSNSSSSSFVIITTEGDYKEAMGKVKNKYSKEVADVLKEVIGGSSKFNFKGQEGISFFGTIYSESYGECAYEVCGDDEDKADEVGEQAYYAIDDLCGFIKELGGFSSQE